jgi:hypothetical protein
MTTEFVVKYTSWYLFLVEILVTAVVVLLPVPYWELAFGLLVFHVVLLGIGKALMLRDFLEEERRQAEQIRQEEETRRLRGAELEEGFP